MKKRLRDRLPKQAPISTYSESLTMTIHHNLNRFKSGAFNMQISVDPMTGLRYAGDLIGLLIEKGVPVKYHRAVLMLNEISDPTDYDGTKLTFLIPADEELEEIMVRHRELD